MRRSNAFEHRRHELGADRDAGKDYAGTRGARAVTTEVTAACRRVNLLPDASAVSYFALWQISDAVRAAMRSPAAAQIDAIVRHDGDDAT